MGEEGEGEGKEEGVEEEQQEEEEEAEEEESVPRSFLTCSPRCGAVVSLEIGEGIVQNSACLACCTAGARHRTKWVYRRTV